MRALIAATIAAATLGIPSVSHAAPPTLTIPDLHHGDTAVVAVAGSSQRIIHLHCDGFDGTGYVEHDYPIDHGTATIFVDDTFPAGPDLCVAELGAYKGNGQFNVVALTTFLVVD